MKEYTPKAGDWVTQYSTGFWRIEKLLPKYADSDYENEKVSWKKGDPIGQWALMRKGFTNKMKFRLDFDCADAQWCKPVTAEQQAVINAYFEEHPHDREKFLTAPWQDRPAVVSIPLKPLTEAEMECFSEALTLLPARFTDEQFRSFAAEHGLNGFITERPEQGDNCMLYLWTNLYETDSSGMQWLFGPVLKRFDV